MGRFEKFAVLGAIAYMPIYIPLFLGYVATAKSMTANAFETVMVFHITGMLLNLVALVLTIRDLYHRPFGSENAKLTWCLLILMTGGIGWLFYVFKYALKPRTPVDPD